MIGELEMIILIVCMLKYIISVLEFSISIRL